MKEVAAIAIFKDDKILMGRRRDNGKWTNPGGHLEGDETPLEGAVREIREESGLNIEPSNLHHMLSKIVTTPKGEKLKIHAFKTELHGDKPSTMKEDPDEEVHRWHWISPKFFVRKEQDNELHVPLDSNVVMEGLGLSKMSEHTKVASSMIDFLYKQAKEYIPGGKAEGKPDSDYPKDQLEKGRIVEMEHTKDPLIANEIAKDHLEEHKDDPPEVKEYYDKPLFSKDLKEGGQEKKAFWQGFSKKAEENVLMSNEEKNVATGLAAFLLAPAASKEIIGKLFHLVDNNEKLVSVAEGKDLANKIKASNKLEDVGVKMMKYAPPSGSYYVPEKAAGYWDLPWGYDPKTVNIGAKGGVNPAILAHELGHAKIDSMDMKAVKFLKTLSRGLSDAGPVIGRRRVALVPTVATALTSVADSEKAEKIAPYVAAGISAPLVLDEAAASTIGMYNIMKQKGFKEVIKRSPILMAALGTYAAMPIGLGVGSKLYINRRNRLKEEARKRDGKKE